MRRRPAVPEGLSDDKAATWRLFVQAYDFTVAERYAWEQHLREADQADRHEAAGEIKKAHDARTRAFRWYRSLKFSPAGGSRKIGRQSDTRWSAARAAGLSDAL
jgi:hypothetical protein